MTSLDVTGPLMDHPTILYALQTVKDGQKMFWLQMLSKSDTLKARGFLHGRYSDDEVYIQCQFERQGTFEEAQQLTTRTWEKGDLNFGPSRQHRSESPSPRQDCYHGHDEQRYSPSPIPLHRHLQSPLYRRL